MTKKRLSENEIAFIRENKGKMSNIDIATFLGVNVKTVLYYKYNLKDRLNKVWDEERTQRFLHYAMSERNCSVIAEKMGMTVEYVRRRAQMLRAQGYDIPFFDRPKYEGVIVRMSDENKQCIEENAEKMTNTEIAELIGFSAHAVRIYKRKHDLKNKRIIWTDEKYKEISEYAKVGMPHKEIAQRMGITHFNVACRLAIARKKGYEVPKYKIRTK